MPFKLQGRRPHARFILFLKPPERPAPHMPGSRSRLTAATLSPHPPPASASPNRAALPSQASTTATAPALCRAQLGCARIGGANRDQHLLHAGRDPFGREPPWGLAGFLAPVTALPAPAAVLRPDGRACVAGNCGRQHRCVCWNEERVAPAFAAAPQTGMDADALSHRLVCRNTSNPAACPGHLTPWASHTGLERPRLARGWDGRYTEYTSSCVLRIIPCLLAPGASQHGCTRT